MAKPNYGFQKRQKELARKKKKAEKQKRKLENKSAEKNGTKEVIISSTENES